jgi:hypothetical protein
VVIQPGKEITPCPEKWRGDVSGDGKEDILKRS